jgi:MFS family permease
MVYTLNFIDRNLLGVVAQPIIAEFGLSDTEYGFLNGPPFALFYALMGIPIAMAADRFNRVAIMALCIAVWSLMTALCGFASSFVFLLIARIGVAIGEAGGTPPSNSIIADYFKPKSRANALGIFATGVTIGGAMASGFGGLIVGLGVGFVDRGAQGFGVLQPKGGHERHWVEDVAGRFARMGAADSADLLHEPDLGRHPATTGERGEPGEVGALAEHGDMHQYGDLAGA